MTDFVESLKDIKKELMKEQKTAPSKENSNEFESLADKEKRLRAEFAEFLKGESILKNIKKA